MHNINKKIMFIFSEEKNSALSTDYLVKHVFKEQYKKAEESINNEYSDSETIKKGKRLKAQLHRKLLYYLNKLVEENILFVSKITGKGEKHYVLNPGVSSYNNLKKYGDSILGLNDYHFNMVESFEHSGQINKFDSSNWYRRLNAILLEPKENINELYEIVNELYMIFNDVIGINDFQKILLTNDFEQIKDFTKKISEELIEYRRHVTLIISLKELPPHKLIEFAEFLDSLNNERLSLIVYADKNEIINKKTLFKELISKNIYLQNKKLCHSPILIGKSGVYTLKEKEYKQYTSELKDKLIGILYGSTTITVDYAKYRNKYSDFRKVIMNSARSLLISTSIQRSKSDLFFFNLNKHHMNYQNDFYKYSSNKIRIKNYFDVREKQEFIDLLNSLNDELLTFSQTEETIFKSCGIPTRHNIHLALNGRVRLNILNRDELKSNKIIWFEKLNDLTNYNGLIVLNLPKMQEDKYVIVKEIFENKKLSLIKCSEIDVKENTLVNYL